MRQLVRSPARAGRGARLHADRSHRSAAQGYMLELSSLQQCYLLDARTYAAKA